MDETILHFERLKVEEKRIKDELDKIKPAVTDILNKLFVEKGEDKEPKIPTEYGSVTRHKTSTWTFPDEIFRREEELDRMKEEAKQMGTATVEVVYSCKFSFKR